MNERIKELVGQAKFMAEETLNKQISANAELNAFAEKFAELIVKECLDVCDSTAMEYAKYRKNESDFDIKNIFAEGEAACDSVKYKIKQKFKDT